MTTRVYKMKTCKLSFPDCLSLRSPCCVDMCGVDTHCLTFTQPLPSPRPSAAEQLSMRIGEHCVNPGLQLLLSSPDCVFPGCSSPFWTSGSDSLSPPLCCRLSATETLASADSDPPRFLHDKSPDPEPEPSSFPAPSRDRSTNRNWTVSPRYRWRLLGRVL